MTKLDLKFGGFDLEEVLRQKEIASVTDKEKPLEKIIRRTVKKRIKSRRSYTAYQEPEIQEPYLILPGRAHGNYSYPDLLVPTKATITGKNWDESHELLHSRGEFMLTLRQYMDLFILLRSGKAQYESGARISHEAADLIYRCPIGENNIETSGEWLDAKFSRGSCQSFAEIFKTVWDITYHRINADGTLTSVNERLKGAFMENRQYFPDGTPMGTGIKSGWLEGATDQGMPPTGMQTSDDRYDLLYYHPKDDHVALANVGVGHSLFEGSTGLSLMCNISPLGCHRRYAARGAKVRK